MKSVPTFDPESLGSIDLNDEVQIVHALDHRDSINSKSDFYLGRPNMFDRIARFIEANKCVFTAIVAMFLLFGFGTTLVLVSHATGSVNATIDFGALEANPFSPQIVERTPTSEMGEVILAPFGVGPNGAYILPSPQPMLPEVPILARPPKVKIIRNPPTVRRPGTPQPPRQTTPPRAATNPPRDVDID